MSHYVYILYSEACDVYYKGETLDLEQRIEAHNLNKKYIYCKQRILGVGVFGNVSYPHWGIKARKNAKTTK